MHVLAGHEHWIFSASFLTEDRLVTGSRDGTVKVWDCSKARWPEAATKPLASGHLVEDKVRDVKASQQQARVVALSMAGTVSVWDPLRMHVLRSEGLKHAEEPVCLALEGEMIAAGSLESIALMDTRQSGGRQLQVVRNGNGVRSLSIAGHLLTAGYSNGQVTFYDLRTQRVLLPTVSGSDAPLEHLTTGQGWSPPRGVSEDWLGAAALEPHACLSHAWDSSGTKLLAAGGPIRPYLKGCYLGLWS